MAKPTLIALVLAAGAGSRFGGGKMLAEWRGRPMLDGALAAAYAAPVDQIIVVSGADPAVEQAAMFFLERWKWPPKNSGQPLVGVQADDWSQGLAASLKAGISALPRGVDGVLVFLGDMPRVPHEVLKPLSDALVGGAPAAVPVWEGEIGHPVAISKALFPAILELSGDRGARAVLEGLGERLVRVPAPDDGVLFDVDTRAALDQD